MLALNLYQKTIQLKDGRSFQTYFVGSKKNGKAKFMDAKLTKSFIASEVGKKALDEVNRNHKVGLMFENAEGNYFFTQKTSKSGVVVGKDGNPIIQMVIQNADSVIDIITLPESEGHREKYQTSDFFDEE